MQVSEVWIELCENLGAPTAVVVLALAVASRFYGLFLREGIVQRSLVAFLYEDPYLPAMLLKGICLNPDNDPITLSGEKNLFQQMVGLEDDIVLFRFVPSQVALRTLENVITSIESNMARQPMYHSVVAAAVEALPDELEIHHAVVVPLKEISFSAGISSLLRNMETSIEKNEDRFHSALEGFRGSRCPDTEWLYAALHLAASFAENPETFEAGLTDHLEQALERSEDILETEGLSQLFVERLYEFCDQTRGIMYPLSSQLNELSEAKESIFYTGDYYFIPETIFSTVCSRIPGIMQSQINHALAKDAFQEKEAYGEKVKFTQGRYLRVKGELRKVRFHKLKRSAVDHNSSETLLWMSNGGVGE